jgi:hypothetical protein
MTSPIGSSNVARSSSLTSLEENRSSKNSGSAGNAGNTSTEKETVHPTPVGPLGHNINTTA